MVFLLKKWWIFVLAVCLLTSCAPSADSGTQEPEEDPVISEDAPSTEPEETRETLPGSYDFDHDGTQEMVELVTVWDQENGEQMPAWYQLEVVRADGTELWRQDLAEAHVGWGSVFACTVDGEDCLLRYYPTMYQGCGEYHYALFSLAETGEEQILQTNSVAFDINFGREDHTGFDPAAIAAFLEEVHGLLAESTLLASTEGGTLRTGGSGAEFRANDKFWDENCPYDEGKSLEENLRNYRDVMERQAEAA